MSDLLNGRVLTDVRRLLVALLLASSGVVLAQAPAYACKCVTDSVKKDLNRADEVFSGVLQDVRTEEVGDRGRRVTVFTIAADTLYKGDLAMSEVEVTSPLDSCGLNSLPVDRRYLWFVSESGGDLSADQCGGTARATDRLTGKVVALAGEGTPLGEPAPPPQDEAEFSKVADAEPETLTRLAAPGLALVLFGLLGLFVVRRRAGS